MAATTLAAASVGFVMPGTVASAAAATREPLTQAMATASRSAPAYGTAARPDRVAALREMTQRSARRYAAAGAEFQISSTYFDSAAVESVAETLRSLDHGPEMAELSVYVATPAEISEACGATVVACYVPSNEEMVVSGIDRPVAGVPRDFAIAHEYGHHIANTRQGEGPYTPLQAGTIRWATYERVCQLTREHRLFPGDQGAHYWQDPEEAFAQSYAHLSRPEDNVSWQYSALLRPSMIALSKIHADVARPWQGPVTEGWQGSVTAPPATRRASGPPARAGGLSVGRGHVAGPLPWVALRRVRTPLDGAVSVSLEAREGTALSVTLRDPEHGRVLARAFTGEEGTASLRYSNCGHSTLQLEVRSRGGAGSFRASISRP